MTPEEALEEHQAEVAGVHDVEMGRLNEHLTNAVSCETIKDFVANLDDALAVLDTMRAELKTWRDDMRAVDKRSGAA